MIQLAEKVLGCTQLLCKLCFLLFVIISIIVFALLLFTSIVLWEKYTKRVL